MCGRFALHLNNRAVRRIPGHDGLEPGEWLDEDQFVPRYNIAPRTQAPVLRRNDAGTGYVLQTMKWGLVPHWSKHEDKTLSTTNARSENLIHGGGMWASIKGRKRCVVICTGYYEWLTKGKDKLPHYIKYKNPEKVMLLAGLYDCATLEGETRPLWTFTVVTTDANKDLLWLHDRQPVILSTREAVEQWLDTSSQSWNDNLTKLVQPYHDDKSPLECYPVPKEVGKVGVESPTFIEPIANRKDGIQAMFMKQKQQRQQSQESPSQSPVKIKSTTPETATSAQKKRTRSESSSEAVDLTSEASPKKPSPSSSSHPAKKLKPEEDEDMKMFSTPKKSKNPAKDRVKSPSKGSPGRRKARQIDPSAESSPKITSFFRKT